MNKELKKLIRDNEEIFKTVRSSSIGTENYYKSSGRFFVYTDGVKEVIERDGLNWFLDCVNSYLSEIKKQSQKLSNYFWVCRCLPIKDDEGLFIIEDGNYHPIVRQDIPYTDLKCNLKMYLQVTTSLDGYGSCDTWVLFMPEEY